MKYSPLAILALSISSASAFSPVGVPRTSLPSSALKMSLEKYSDELVETANKLSRPGYGLLACDESTGTVGARLESIGVENIEENRAEVSIFHYVAMDKFPLPKIIKQ